MQALEFQSDRGTKALLFLLSSTARLLDSIHNISPHSFTKVNGFHFLTLFFATKIFATTLRTVYHCITVSLKVLVIFLVFR